MLPHLSVPLVTREPHQQGRPSSGRGRSDAAGVERDHGRADGAAAEVGGVEADRGGVLVHHVPPGLS